MELKVSGKLEECNTQYGLALERYEILQMLVVGFAKNQVILIFDGIFITCKPIHSNATLGNNKSIGQNVLLAGMLSKH